MTSEDFDAASDTCEPPRLEQKFLIKEFDHEAAALSLKLHSVGFIEEYPMRSVHSIYFDDEDLSLAQAHRMGVSRRRKLRIRWYGKPFEESCDAFARSSNMMLESKTRNDHLIQKSRLVFSARRLAHRQTAEWPGIWRHWMAGMRPICLVSYTRRYFVTIDRTIRSTLDFALVARPHDDWQNLPHHHRTGCSFPLLLGELKCVPAQAKDAARVAQSLPWAHVQHSKFMRAVDSCLSMTREILPNF